MRAYVYPSTQSQETLPQRLPVIEGKHSETIDLAHDGDVIVIPPVYQ